MEQSFDYDRFCEDARKFYTTLRPLWSHALNDFVCFTAEGFNHLLFKSSRRERECSSQIVRFKLLPRAVTLIGHSTTYQEYEETIREFESRDHKRRVWKNKTIRYWGIIAIIDRRKIKVVLRKIGDTGQLHFWSVIPAWTTSKHRDIKLFSTMDGNPEED